ncbi:MAG: hypothetical protein KJP12_04440 [Acidimicrobiia bacterium]|nr:hypothetical protein [Acidimicrobiia bacterium]MBT8214452.1 hypothetical protein [Acidimicrobiia bacterium]NNF69383.1 hypothetical protein [Acidimicrobiia bacterium]
MTPSDTSGPRRWNRWLFRQEEWPEQRVPGTRFDLYVLGAILIIASVIVMIGSILLVTGVIGSGVSGRVQGSLGIVAAVALYLVGRWLSFEPGRRHWEREDQPPS